MLKYSGIVVAMIAGLTTGPVGARELGDIFSVSGFGTLGVVHSSEERADFVDNGIFQPDGAGFTHSWSPHVDSKLGLQINGVFTERLTAIVQLVSESAYNNSWDGDINRRYFPSLEWANLKYQITPDFNVRVGRFALPTFMLSDFRKVGYALTTLRAPVALYGMIPMTSSDGVESSYRLQMGSMTHTLSVHYGRSSVPTQLIKARFDDQWGGFYTLESGGFTGRVSYNHVHVKSLDPVTGANPFAAIFQPTFGAFGAAVSGIPGLESIGAQALNIANRYSSPGYTYKYLAFGASYDQGAWLVSAEWARQQNNGLFHNQRSWYVTGGYRVGSFTPYLTLARADVKFNSDTGLPASQLPSGPLQDNALALNGLLQALIHSANYGQRNIAAGTRWDVWKNIALKAQYDYYRFPTGSSGYLINLQPGFTTGGNLSLISLSVDFVF